MTNQEIIDEIKKYDSSTDRKRLENLRAMYDAKNPEILKRWEDKARRNRTPNNLIPSAYYSTLSDTMGGYMFQDVQYTAEDETKQQQLNELAEKQMFPVKDMRGGIGALAYNKAVEYIYTDETPEVQVGPLDPVNTIIGRSEDINQTPIWFIYYTKEKVKEKTKYNVLYVEPKLERRFTVQEKEVSGLEEKALFFDELPLVEYRAQVIGEKAPFEVCIPYIAALDALLSGNSNEVDRLVDAILLLGKMVDKEELRHADEWKVLQDIQADERAEYLTKDTSPEFRRYVSELLIREIHKHAHVIDWYSPDQGQSTEASGKALRTRLYDMETYSKRIELAYMEGAKKRMRLIDAVLSIQKKPIGPVKITFKRTMIDDFIDDAVKLSTVTFLSDATKREHVGVDNEKELERLSKEVPAAPNDMFNEE